ncbi:hypothetical protein JCM10003_2346 [Bacteroides pyogenes JCM 10003]|nr:hypothetical protein JCM10003_2346 [Bacteroides pyogenes JCM 10003]
MEKRYCHTRCNPYNGSCHPKADKLMMQSTNPVTHSMNSDHFSTLPIGCQWNNWRRME